MRSIVLTLFVAVMCSSCKGDPQPSVVAPSTAEQHPAATPSAPSQPHRNKFADRIRPAHTFDLLSAPIAPGASTTQTVTLADGWKVTDKPKTADEGTAFVIDSAETSADGKTYTVKAHNTGKIPVRFVADVPCSGCP
jgi:hypothetical protein